MSHWNPWLAIIPWVCYLQKGRAIEIDVCIALMSCIKYQSI